MEVSRWLPALAALLVIATQDVRAESVPIEQGSTNDPSRIISSERSPDGRWVANVESDERAFHRRAVIRDLLTSKLYLDTGLKAGSNVHWSPDGKRFARNGAELQVWSFESRSKLVSLELPKRGYASFAWSPDGKYIAIADEMIASVTIHESDSLEAVTQKSFEEFHDMVWKPSGTVELTDLGGKKQKWRVPLLPSGQVRRTPIRMVVIGVPGYIPKNLSECMVQLDKELPRDVVADFRSTRKSDLIKFHMGFGTWLRNAWGLWAGSRLAQYFRYHGVSHPEAMSSVIIRCYKDHLVGVRIDDKAIQSHRSWD